MKAKENEGRARTGKIGRGGNDELPQRINIPKNNYLNV